MSSRVEQILRWLSLLAAVFAFGLVMFGAFVRLSNAGLSCPDWPTCYGEATWPQHAQAVARADAAFPDRPYEAHKAWREQVHRMLAGTLGVLVLALALLAAWRRRWIVLALAGSAVLAAVGVAMYMRGEHDWSSLLAACAIALPLAAALALRRPAAWRVSLVALGVIIFQAMLGMWTVTLLLKPIVVTGHLLGGMTTFALLGYAAVRFAGVGAADDALAGLRRLVVLGIVLLACQIALGGWTSSNYAALACGFGDAAFPQCLGQWWPPGDYHQGFVLWRGIGVDYEGGVLDGQARIAIQLVHRAMALVVFLYVWVLALRLLRMPGMRGWGVLLALLVTLQVALGIANIKYALPLPVAVGHNAGAALLLFTLVTLLARLRAPLTGHAG